MAQAPLRILCLHGYQQAGVVFRNRIGGLRRVLKKSAEFVFIDAPFKAQWRHNGVKPVASTASGGKEDELESKAGPPELSWYEFNVEGPPVITGVDTLMEVVDDAVRVHGPFDGLMGFSQGAAVAALIAAYSVHPDESKRRPFPFKFAVLYSGFRVRDPSYHALLDPERPLPFKVMSIWGKADKVIAPEKSQLLTNCFEDPETFVHPGGHYVPSKAALSRLVLKFIQERQAELATVAAPVEPDADSAAVAEPSPTSGAGTDAPAPVPTPPTEHGPDVEAAEGRGSGVDAARAEG